MSDLPPRHAGRELAANGWDQGCAFQLAAASMSYLRIEDTTENWVRGEDVLSEGDLLVVVTQACDIVKKPEVEPYVEVARAFWTNDKALIRDASNNSVRNFCLQRRAAPEGQSEEGLIVDATFRIHIRKEGLLAVKSERGFAANDHIGPARFRRWLGARYNRQPIPDHLVDAVQRPVVEGLRRLKPDDVLWRVLDGIGEILYYADDREEPYRVEMLFIRDERADAPDLAELDVDRLAGWVSERLKSIGKAALDSQRLTDLRSLSVYDYLTLHRLPLDSYSLPETDD